MACINFQCLWKCVFGSFWWQASCLVMAWQDISINQILDLALDSGSVTFTYKWCNPTPSSSCLYFFIVDFFKVGRNLLLFYFLSEKSKEKGGAEGPGIGPSGMLVTPESRVCGSSIRAWRYLVPLHSEWGYFGARIRFGECFLSPYPHSYLPPNTEKIFLMLWTYIRKFDGKD